MRYLLFTGWLLIISCALLMSQVQVMSISPAHTGNGIVPIHGDHQVLIDISAKRLRKLVVMINGTGASAKDNFPFDSFAAAKGYDVISLDYKNTVITTVCSNSNDSACFNGFRQEIVFGEPVSSPVVEVDSSNSIYYRLYALLQYLAAQYPMQGWQRYISKGAIQWRDIIVAGHSQGAGHAAYLGKKFPLYKVLIFAGPQDFLVHFNTPAEWLSQKSITPASKYYAFLHLKDPFDFNKQLAGCVRLMQSLTTDTVLVKPGIAVKTKRHILVTNVDTGNPHGSMLQPAFKSAWAYLLSPNKQAAKK
ncbi:MAG: hypothetical protein ABIQ88_11650 [Chitinophagaceae bacterium]